MNTDIQLLFKHYKSDTDKAIEWIRSHPNEKSISVTSNVKKIYYGHGYKCCDLSDYGIEIKSDGVYIRNCEGADTNKYSYSAIVKELKEYMEREAVPVPVHPERASEVADTFNYAVLSSELGNYLKQMEERLRNEYMNFTANCGRIFAEAQERLAKNGFGEENGMFRKWIASMGFSKTTVYRMIDIYKFRLSQIGTDEGRTFFDALPKTLQADISAPSAPPKLVEQVMSGDITTHKDYIALKKELEEAEAKKEFWIKANSDTNKENQQLRADRNIALSRADNAERKLSEAEAKIAEIKNNLDTEQDYIKSVEERVEYAEQQNVKMSTKNSELERRIRELESRPVDVAVDVDELNRRVTEVANKMNSEMEHTLAEERREFAETLNAKDDRIWELEDKVKSLENRPAPESKEKILAFKMSMDQYKKLLEIVNGSNNGELCKILQGVKIFN